MRLKNAKLYGQEGLWNIEIQEDLIQSIISAKTDESNSDQNEIDLNGKIVLPPYVEPHIHLDYVLTAGTPRWNQSGSVFEGIEIWSERKQVVNETKEDIKQRALSAMKMQLKHGIQYVRTHVDVSDPTLKGLEALLFACLCHMTDHDHIVTALDLITTNGAKTLSIENDYGVKEGNKANLIVIDSDSEYEAIRTQAPVLYSIRNGQIIVQTKPAET